MQYKLGESGTYGTAIPQETDAGTYEVYYKVAGDANHNDYEAASPVSITIGKADAGVTSAPAAKAELTYTGSAQDLISGGSASGGTMQYKLGESGTYGTAIPQGTNAGTYEVYYKVAGDANHNDYEAPTPVSITIGKANSSVNTAPAAKVGLKYNGSAQDLMSAGSASGGTMQYKLDESGMYGTAIPQGTDAGTYQVYYKVKGDANHNDYEAATPISVTMDKADAPSAPGSVTGSYAVSTTDNTKFVYSVDTIAGAEYSKDGTTYQDSNVFDGIAPSSTLTFYARMKETENVNVGAAGNTGAVTFNKLNNANVPVLEYQVTGNSGNRKITVTPVTGAEYSFDNGATWSDTNEKDGINDAIISVQIRYKASATLNASAPSTASVNTAKQTQTVSFAESAVSKKYSDADFEITAANDKADGGAIEYSSSDTNIAVVDKDTGNVTIKGHGTVTIKAKAVENTIYAQSAEAAYTLTVAKGIITIAAKNKNAYVGDTEPALGETDYTVTGLREGETLATPPAITYESAPDMSASGTAVIKVIGAEAPAGGNYEEIVYQNGTLTISTKPSGGFVPAAQKPTIETGEGVKVDLSADGTKATITVEEGYELADVVLNGVSKGKVTEVTGLKTGDKLVVTAEKQASDGPTKEEIQAQLKDQRLAARSKVVTMKNGKKAVKITWYNENGEMMDFDGVEIYRSTKRYSGFGKAPLFDTEKNAYYNTAVKEGTKYFYKVRGYMEFEGEKIYTEYSMKAIRTVK